MSKWVPSTDPVLLRRMGKLGEELGELQAVCSRVIIQGLDGMAVTTRVEKKIEQMHEWEALLQESEL